MRPDSFQQVSGVAVLVGLGVSVWVGEGVVVGVGESVGEMVAEGGGVGDVVLVRGGCVGVPVKGLASGRIEGVARVVQALIPRVNPNAKIHICFNLPYPLRCQVSKRQVSYLKMYHRRKE